MVVPTLEEGAAQVTVTQELIDSVDRLALLLAEYELQRVCIEEGNDPRMFFIGLPSQEDQLVELAEAAAAVKKLLP